MDDTGEDAYLHKFTVGDYNIALNPNLDTSGYLHIHNHNSREFLVRTINLCNLVDIWRLRNPNTRQYTFNKKQTKNYKRSRLDFFLASVNSTEIIKNVLIGKVCN